METQIHTGLTAPDNQQAQTVQQGQVHCKVNVLHHSSQRVVMETLSTQRIKAFPSHILLTSANSYLPACVA